MIFFYSYTCEMDYDILEFCDILPPARRHIPHSGSTCMTFVNFEAYMKDLYKGQETMEKARNQLQIDMPRCNFCIDGEPCTDQTLVPDVLVRFCTQAVLALPLDLIWSPEYVILDSLKRMMVDVWDTCVFIKKEMHIIQDGTRRSFDIIVRVDVLEVFVCIEINFSSAEEICTETIESSRIISTDNGCKTISLVPTGSIAGADQ